LFQAKRFDAMIASLLLSFLYRLTLRVPAPKVLERVGDGDSGRLFDWAQAGSHPKRPAPASATSSSSTATAATAAATTKAADRLESVSSSAIASAAAAAAAAAP